MTRAVRKSWSAWSAFALLAVVLRLLAPQGFMPAKDASDGLTLVICTGKGLATITLDEHGRPAKPPAKDPRPETCPFAGHGAPATLAAAPPPPVPAETFVGEDGFVVPPTAATLALAAPPPPALGPPSPSIA